MRPASKEVNADPKWIVFVRPIGFPNKPWEQRSVSAQSANQADTILRSAGYEMQTGTAYRSTESWPEIEPLKPPALLCTKCDYEIDGLTVAGACVTCPECANKQIVVAWSPTHNFEHKGNSALTTGLSIVGAIVMTFIGVMVLFTVASMF